MKKKYTKPEIIFESFTLSTNIASGCEVKPDTQADFNSCCVEFAGYFIFGTDHGGCQGDSSMWITVEPYKSALDGTCYHTPSDANNIFTS